MSKITLEKTCILDITDSWTKQKLNHMYETNIHVIALVLCTDTIFYLESYSSNVSPSFWIHHWLYK